MTNKKYLIEKLLKVRWAKAEFSKTLWIWQAAINNFLNRWARTLGSQKKYTEAFNKCFETEYSYKELFSLIDNN